MTKYGYSSRKDIYTIWEVTFVYEPLDNNRRFVNYTYKYIKRTTEKPAELDKRCNERLRSFTARDIEYTNDDTFRFGKCKGQNIANVHDLDYTCWYFKNIENNHKEWVKNWLLDNGCEFRMSYRDEEYAVTPERLNKERETAKRVENTINEASEGKTVYLFIPGNLDSSGKITIDGVTYTFPKIKSQHYMGFTYYIPVRNGAPKRIKNKTIKARLMYFDGEIFVSNFEVVNK